MMLKMSWRGGPYSKNYPERVAARMLAEGILRLDPDGSVWRLRRYGKGGDGVTYPMTPKRIDYGPPGEHRMFEIRLEQGRHSKVQVARFIWQVHKGDIPPLMTVNHQDGKPDNNVLSNYELTTHSGNHKHRFDMLGQKAPTTVREALLVGFVNAAERALATGDLEPIREALRAYQERPLAHRTKWYARKKERERQGL